FLPDVMLGHETRKLQPATVSVTCALRHQRRGSAPNRMCRAIEPGVNTDRVGKRARRRETGADRADVTSSAAARPAPAVWRRSGVVPWVPGPGRTPPGRGA